MLDFFKGRNIFITGNTGFKGSWLSYILKAHGANVYGYALKPENESNYNILDIGNGIHQTFDDIRNKDSLSSAIKKANPEIVFHLAAQAIVKDSYDDPYKTFETNVMGSVNILQSIVNSDTVKSLVFITSDKCYEHKEWIWGYRENDSLGGKDPYSASKAAAEIIFNAYLKSFFEKKSNINIASTRAGNVIGGGDFAIDRLVPDCIRSIKRGNNLILRNPYSTRPWQHVLEPLSGYLTLSQKLFENEKSFEGSWNFGPSTGEIGSVDVVAKAILSNFKNIDIEYDIDQKAVYEAGLLQLNCDKAHSLLGWGPKWNLEQTMNETALWYKAYLENKDMNNFTLDQINRYFN